MDVLNGVLEGVVESAEDIVLGITYKDVNVVALYNSNITVTTTADSESILLMASTSVADKLQFCVELKLTMFMQPSVPSITPFCT